MAGEQTMTTLDGLFKDQFHDKIEDLIPDHAILQKGEDGGLIKWVESSKQNGQHYSVPTLLRSNQGVTYLGESGAAGLLKSAKNAVMKEALVNGTEMNVRGQITYKTLSAAAEKGPKAFAKASAWLVEDLARVMHTRVEIAALYGQTGLGVIESAADVSGGPGSEANIVVTEASFAPGMWILLEGATLDAFTADSKNNQQGVLTVVTVTTSTRTIKVTHTNTYSDEMAAGDVLWFEGTKTDGTTFSEMCGLYKQLTDASSTSLFNLNRSAYALLQGNTGSSTGRLTKAKIVDFAMKLLDKGALGELVLLVSPKAWGVLNSEDMALRRFDGSYSKEKSRSGSKELVYDVNIASVRVIAHPFVKQGEAFMFNPDDIIWIGSSKPTFEIPGFKGEFFRLVQDTNACEIQNYADLAIYALKPAQGGVMTGITYS